MSDSEDKASNEQDPQNNENKTAENQEVSELTVKVDNVQLEENKGESKPASNYY